MQERALDLQTCILAANTAMNMVLCALRLLQLVRIQTRTHMAHVLWLVRFGFAAFFM